MIQRLVKFQGNNVDSQTRAKSVPYWLRDARTCMKKNWSVTMHGYNALHDYNARMQCMDTMHCYNARWQCTVIMHGYNEWIQCKDIMRSYNTRSQCTNTLHSYSAHFIFFFLFDVFFLFTLFSKWFCVASFVVNWCFVYKQNSSSLPDLFLFWWSTCLHYFDWQLL